MQYGNLSDVKQAINLLYNSKDQGVQRNANEWLQNFQKQSEAWDVASELLKDDNMLVVFFGAHTLCNKIRYDLNELPDSSIQQLFVMLFEAAKHFKNSTTSVRNEICLVIATLLIRWTGVTDIVNVAVKNIGTSETDTMLLNVLSLLPVELQSRRIPIFEKQREEKLADMQQSASNVLQYMNHLLQTSSNNEELVENVFQCFEAWVSLGSFTAEELSSTVLLPSLFQAIHIPELFEVCSDALNEVLSVFSDLSRDTSVIDIILPQIAGMKPLAVEAVSSHDFNMCRRITLIYSQLGNDYLSLLIDDSNAYKGELLDTMFILYSFPSIDIADLCVPFWEELLVVLQSPEPGSPVYQLVYQLMTASLPHLKFPSDAAQMNEDDVFDFREKRRAVSEIIKNCYLLLGEKVVIQFVLQSFDEAVQEFLQRSDAEKSNQWQRLESLLYLLRCIGAPYDLTLQNVLHVVDVVFALPSILPLEQASLRLLSTYCRLLCNEYSLLERILNFFFQKVENPELHRDCVDLFLSVCKDCASSIIRNTEFTERLLQLYQTIPSQMDESDKCIVLEGLCNVIRMLPSEQAISYIVLYLDWIKSSIRTICAMHTVNGAAEELVTMVHLMTVVIRYVARPNSSTTDTLVSYFEGNWNLFSEILSVFGQNEDVVEAVCRFFKYFMRQNQSRFTSLLQSTTNLILEGFRQTHISSYIYCGSVIVGEYGCYDKCQSIIHQILTEFCDSTLAFLASSPDAYTQNPFIVEDLYDLCGRSLQTIPQVMFSVEDVILRITQAAIVGIQLQHREANRSILRFLDCLLMFGREQKPEEGEIVSKESSFRPQVLRILQVCGQDLMNQLVFEKGENNRQIAALIGGLPESRIKELGVTVVSVLASFYDSFEEIFMNLLSASIESIPEKLFSQQEKKEFLQEIYQKNYNIGRFEKSMIRLSSITRSRAQHE